MAPFFPASNVMFYVGTFIGERLLYCPSIGFCLLAAEGTTQVAAALKQRKCHCQSCEIVQNTLQGHPRDETARQIHIAALVFSADQSLADELTAI